jgi:hypothetical protein
MSDDTLLSFPDDLEKMPLRRPILLLDEEVEKGDIVPMLGNARQCRLLEVRQVKGAEAW